MAKKQRGTRGGPVASLALEGAFKAAAGGRAGGRRALSNKRKAGHASLEPDHSFACRLLAKPICVKLSAAAAAANDDDAAAAAAAEEINNAALLA